MRSTVIRLIAGGALGIAFSISLTLPGSVVFPEELPVRQLDPPKGPTAKVLHAAPLVERLRKAPARPRVVVQRVYVPGAAGTTVVRQAPPRSKPPRKPVERARVPVEQRLTPLAAPPAAPVTEREETERADEPKKADRPRKAEKPRAEKPQKSEKPRKAEKPKKAKKPKHSGSEKKDKPNRKQDRDDQDEGRGGHEKGEDRGGRGDNSFRS